ncbi:MAG: putative lipid II flippase FtsW [Acidobacteria bacterium]|nr:putative lipid II flippase FtsW [Acidobacteriota bacterium]
MMMQTKVVSDKFIFMTALVLVAFGVIMVYSASSVLAAEKFGDHRYFLIRQGLWALVGLAAMLAAIKLDYRFYQKLWIVYLILFICVGLLVAVLFAPSVNNAHRWLRWRFVSFQPAEAAKLGLIIFLASYLSRRISDGLENFWRTFAPCAAVAGSMMVLIAVEPDLGMAMGMGCIMLVAFFVAGVPWRHQALMALGALPGLYYLLFHVSWRLERLLIFIDPWRDPQGRGFQSIQSMVAIGSGGLFGTGFAQGRQKLFYLPEPHTDFIFAQMGEELGLVGLVLIVIAFAIFLWRGVRVSLRAPDAFGALLGVNITMAIVGQALFNMSVTLGLAPVKGMPLPLISYGGSALLMTLIEIGILLNIAHQAREYVD